MDDLQAMLQRISKMCERPTVNKPELPKVTVVDLDTLFAKKKEAPNNKEAEAPLPAANNTQQFNCTCPHCHQEFPVAVQYIPGKSQTPSSGDFLICGKCGEIAVLNAELIANTPELSDWVRLSKHPAEAEIHKYSASIKERLKNQPK